MARELVAPTRDDWRGARWGSGARHARTMAMDVLFTIAMLGVMAASIVVLGRTWPRSSRGGGYRAGRGYGADGPGGRDEGRGPADATGDGPPVPQEDDAPWRWPGEADGADAPGDAGGGEAAR